MIQASGSLILNGVTDRELIKILEVKAQHEQVLTFNPQQMQLNTALRPGQPPIVRQTVPPQPVNTIQVYNNVVLGWHNEHGLEAVQEIVRFLIKKEEQAAQSGGQ